MTHPGKAGSPVMCQLGEVHENVHALAREIVAMLAKGGAPLDRQVHLQDDGFDDFSSSGDVNHLHSLSRLREEAMGKIEHFNQLGADLFSLMDQLMVQGGAGK
ncbi:MAG: hypothetical protein HQL55_08820 [Magnetococcales bacterium]|nr:hypothetical protein [Magnetococcales bacterium]